MIKILEELEQNDPILKVLNRKISEGSIISRFSFSELKDFALYLQNVPISISDDYYTKLIDRFSPVEYQLMLSISKDPENQGLKHRVRMMNQKTRRIVQREQEKLKEQSKSKRWWSKK